MNLTTINPVTINPVTISLTNPPVTKPWQAQISGIDSDDTIIQNGCAFCGGNLVTPKGHSYGSCFDCGAI